jgi:hypothetical protein
MTALDGYLDRQKAAKDRLKALEAESDASKGDGRGTGAKVGTVAGGIIGAYFGNPVLGMQVGGALGGAAGSALSGGEVTAGDVTNVVGGIAGAAADTGSTNVNPGALPEMAGPAAANVGSMSPEAYQAYLRRQEVGGDRPDASVFDLIRAAYQAGGK